jgi:hypothetical protein
VFGEAMVAALEATHITFFLRCGTSGYNKQRKQQDTNSFYHHKMYSGAFKKRTG